MYKRVVLRRMYAKRTLKKEKLMLKKCKVAEQPNGPLRPSTIPYEKLPLVSAISKEGPVNPLWSRKFKIPNKI